MYPEEFRRAVVERAAEVNDVVAAREFGVSRHTIIRWRQSAGVESGYAPPERTAAHGSPTMYQHHGCRCDECRTAHNRRHAAMRRYRTLRLAQDPTLAPHGSVSTYGNWGCRCDECRAVWSALMRERAARRKAKRAS